MSDANQMREKNLHKHLKEENWKRSKEGMGRGGGGQSLEVWANVADRNKAVCSAYSKEQKLRSCPEHQQYKQGKFA